MRHRPTNRRAPRTWPGHGNPLAELARTIAEHGRVGPLDDAEAPGTEGGRPGYSPRALLRRKSFEQCTDDELRRDGAPPRAGRAQARHPPQPPPRPLARTAPPMDLRRSFRRALARDGEFIDLARRERAIELPRMVVLCDTSGSMDPYSRLLLTFVLALGKVARRTETFAFNTLLTRLTPWIAAGNVAATLSRFAREVEDWSGGTRIGRMPGRVSRTITCGTTVSGDTSILIFSDGLDRGDTGALEQALSGDSAPRPACDLAQPPHGRFALPSRSPGHEDRASPRGSTWCRPTTWSRLKRLVDLL